MLKVVLLHLRPNTHLAQHPLSPGKTIPARHGFLTVPLYYAYQGEKKSISLGF